MTENNSDSARSSERHIQTLMQLAIFGIAGWLAWTTQNLQVEIATLNERVSGMVNQIDTMNITLRDRYTASQAERDWKPRDAIITDLLERVRKLEEKAK